MAKILTSNNAQIFRQLGTRQFRGTALDHEVATSAGEILARTRYARPALVILDDVLPDGSGFDVCRRIKDDPALARTRVMMILDNPATQEQLRRAEASRCDDILCLPAPTDELFGHIAAVLGFPDADSRRMREKLFATLDLGKTKVRGEVVDLGDTAARLLLTDRITPPPRVAVHFSRGVTGASHDVVAQVGWQRQPAPGGAWEGGLTYERLDAAALARLRAACLWNVSSTEGGVLVTFRGDFVESSDFRSLLDDLGGATRVEMDLAQVSRLNSVGACRWAEVMLALTGRSVAFVRCSLEFTSHAAMTPGMLGDGRVDSLYAPYACEACGATELKLLQVATLRDGDGGIRPPRLRCVACGGALAFDDIPERYLSFLLT